MSAATVVVAGAAGDLGGRIVAELVARMASVRAVLRLGSTAAARERLTALGAMPITADVEDVGSLAEACADAACVVSAWSGLRDVIVERQSLLIDAAVKAGVPRFISSDFSADYTKTQPGSTGV